VGQARNRSRQRFDLGRVGVRDPPLVELVEQPEDPGPPFRRLVEPDVELGDPLDPEPATELVADERHRMLERRDRRLPFIGLADHAHPHTGMPQIGRGLHVGYGRKPNARIRYLA
jgi:hypothetical protein